MLFKADIKWLDTQEVCEGVLMKVGDINEENDDNIFFYLESEDEIDSFKEEGVHEFIVLNSELLS